VKSSANQSEVLASSQVHSSCIPGTPAFRLAEQWINQASRKIEIFTAEKGTPEKLAGLRQKLRDARALLDRCCDVSADKTPELLDLLKQYLRPEDFSLSEIPGAYWLETPMGSIPLLALPAGDVNELSCRSKAHILVGLASSREENPVAGGFLFLSNSASFHRYTDPQWGVADWLQSQRILPVDSWGLRVLLIALRCHAETHECLRIVSNRS
jgi:hypothetical protein